MHTSGGYLDRKTRSPLGLGAAIAINGGLIAALLLANPAIVPAPFKVIEGFNVPIVEPDPVPPPPTPPELKLRPQPVRESFVTPSKPVIEPRQSDFVTGIVPPGPPPPLPGSGGIGDGAQVVIQPRLPVFVGSQIDKRYAAALQPPYPPGKIRSEEEGVVVVRVLIGPDSEIIAKQKIDLAIKKQREAEFEKRKQAKMKEFQKVEKQLDALGL